MRIGILGAGNIGAMLAAHFVGAGHEVAISNSRGPETLADLVADLGADARAVTADEAARFGDVVVVSIPLKAYLPDAHVVKVFNSIRAGTFRDQAHTGPVGSRLGVPIAGDNEAAKQQVDDLLEEIGFDGVDAGALGEGGRKFQVGSPLYGAELPSAELAERLAG